jgi:hypothetical protein
VTERLLNPYEGCRGRWVRGSIHGHSREGSACATVPLATGVARYAVAGSAFVTVTDHDHVTDLSEMRARHPELAFLEGFEYSKCENVLFVGEKVPPLHRLPLQEALAAADGLLTVICHPTPSRSREYWTVDMIMALDPPPMGLEIFNGHYIGPHGIYKDPNPLYTDTWDALLDRGLRAWGFANDDYHDPVDLGRAFNMVNVEEVTASALVQAMRAGQCYASTGLLLESIADEGTRVSVRLAGSARGRFVGEGGRILAESEGLEFAFDARSEPRVRFEAEGRQGRVFLQPFFSTR